MLPCAGQPTLKFLSQVCHPEKKKVCTERGRQLLLKFWYQQKTFHSFHSAEIHYNTYIKSASLSHQAFPPSLLSILKRPDETVGGFVGQKCLHICWEWLPNNIASLNLTRANLETVVHPSGGSITKFWQQISRLASTSAVERLQSWQKCDFSKMCPWSFKFWKVPSGCARFVYLGDVSEDVGVEGEVVLRDVEVSLQQDVRHQSARVSCNWESKSQYTTTA